MSVGIELSVGNTAGLVDLKDNDPSPEATESVAFVKNEPELSSSPFHAVQFQNKEAFAQQGKLPKQQDSSILHVVTDSTLEKIRRKDEGHWVKQFVSGLIAASNPPSLQQQHAARAASNPNVIASIRTVGVDALCDVESPNLPLSSPTSAVPPLARSPVGYAAFRQLNHKSNAINAMGRPLGWSKEIYSRGSQNPVLKSEKMIKKERRPGPEPKKSHPNSLSIDPSRSLTIKTEFESHSSTPIAKNVDSDVFTPAATPSKTLQEYTNTVTQAIQTHLAAIREAAEDIPRWCKLTSSVLQRRAQLHRWFGLYTTWEGESAFTEGDRATWRKCLVHLTNDHNSHLRNAPRAKEGSVHGVAAGTLLGGKMRCAVDRRVMKKRADWFT